MKKKNIKSAYLKQIELLNNHNKSYYEYSRPLISDTEYDNLKNEVLDLEKKNLFLKSKDSPSLVVGFKPSKNFQKVKHRVPMLSLGNAFNEDDLKNFEKKIINFLSLKNLLFFFQSSLNPLH